MWGENTLSIQNWIKMEEFYDQDVEPGKFWF